MLIVLFVLLVGVANATPVLARELFNQRFSQPLDGGRRWIDGRALFGPSKTRRGVLLSVLMTTAAAVVLGLGWQVGALTGAMAMLGDLFSSFIKRRLGRPSSSKMTGVDQIPEVLFPALACQRLLAFSATDMILIVTAFFIAERVLSPLFYRLSVRKRPY